MESNKIDIKMEIEKFQAKNSHKKRSLLPELRNGCADKKSKLRLKKVRENNHTSYQYR